MKKFAPYIIILSVLIGLFSPTLKVQALSPDGSGVCSDPSSNNIEKKGLNQVECETSKYIWTKNPAYVPPIGLETPKTTTSQEQSGLLAQLDVCDGVWDWTVSGCIEHIAYILFYMFPAFLLYIAAYFFNVLVSITLYSTVFSSPFLAASWGIVRDLSNIFFILILLYIAIRLILGLGGHGTKTMITSVILMALLINFSMLFTKIVIDTSNILAVIFYNKINVETTENGKHRDYNSLAGEKDMAGLTKAFDPTHLLDQKFFDRAATQKIPNAPPGTPATKGQVPFSIILGMILLSGTLMFFAAYAFFVSGGAFLGRLIELFVVIIFSPFAFMSFTIPLFERMEYIGWHAWFHRLMKTAFMAPIFMFFLYFIFKIVGAKIFDGLLTTANNESWVTSVFLILLPAGLILMLLLQAVKFAKEGSGAFGSFFVKTAELAAGVAIGGGIGAVAAAGQGTLGHLGKIAYENKTLTEADAKGSKFARGLRAIGGKAATSSFDARAGAIGLALKAASTATGANLGTTGAGSKFFLKESGGYEADLKRRDAARKKRAEGLKIKEGEDEKQKLNQYEEEHQKVSHVNEQDLHDIDLALKSAEDKAKAYSRAAANPNASQEIKRQAEEANSDYLRIKGERGDMKNGGEILDKDGKGTGVYRTHNGKISEEMVTKYKSIAEATGKVNIDAKKAVADLEIDRSKAITEEAEAMKAEKDALDKIKTATAEVEKFKNNPNSDSAKVAATTLSTTKAEAEKAQKETKKASENVVNVTHAYALAEQHAAKASEKAVEADEKAKRANTAALNGYGNSQNKYEDKLLPHQKHKAEEVSKGRARKYATSMENSFAWPWNQAARKKSAHEIRMGVKVEKGHGGHGPSFGQEIAAGVIAELITPHSSGGGDSHGASKGGGGDAHASEGGHH